MSDDLMPCEDCGTPQSSARLSSCGRYRYELRRRWSDAPPLVFAMLNPSTADAEVDDPTTRRCLGFARREGAGGIIVVNLFALRSTAPAALLAERDPVGPDNAAAISTICADPAPVVAAWGAHRATRTPDAQRMISCVVSVAGSRLLCLGTTNTGAPRHPLYLPAAAPLMPWP